MNLIERELNGLPSPTPDTARKLNEGIQRKHFDLIRAVVNKFYHPDLYEEAIRAILGTPPPPPPNPLRTPQKQNPDQHVNHPALLPPPPIHLPYPSPQILHNPPPIPLLRPQRVYIPHLRPFNPPPSPKLPQTPTSSPNPFHPTASHLLPPQPSPHLPPPQKLATKIHNYFRNLLRAHRDFEFDFIGGFEGKYMVFLGAKFFAYVWVEFGGKLGLGIVDAGFVVW